MQQTYEVSGWNARKEQYEVVCLVNADNMAVAIIVAHRKGWLRHEQVDTAKVSIKGDK